MSFINQVINELHMTKEDLSMFTPPAVIYQNYCRNIIYSIRKYEFELLEIVAQFPANIRTVREKQKVLIMFVEVYPKYQDNNFIMIWFKFAHEMFLTKQKIYIEEFEFQSPKKNNTSSLSMSFSQTLNQNTASLMKNVNFQEEEDEYDDDGVLNLCQQLKKLKI